MTVKFGDTKTFPSEASMPIVGSFSLENPFNWYKCREQFAKHFDENICGFFFSHPGGVGQRIAAFIDKTEDVLSVVNIFEDKTVFCKTNRPYATWVSPSSFWKKCFMRRSLFTILLRAGFEYMENEDNYEETLYSCKYIKDTELAVRRFLFGHTKLVENDPPFMLSKGWRDFFVQKSFQEVKSSLTLPGEEALVEKILIATGAIWN